MNNLLLLLKIGIMHLGQGETYLSKHLVLCRSFIFVGVGIFEYCDISAWFYALLLLSLGLICMYCYKMKKNTTVRQVESSNRKIVERC